MTEYTPSTEAVGYAYIMHKESKSFSTRDNTPDYEDEFYRWLTEVKAQACTHTFAQQLEEHSLAELIRMAKAQAWEEGYANGNADAFTEARLDRDNPYREHSHTARSSFGDPYCATCGIDLEDTE